MHPSKLYSIIADAIEEMKDSGVYFNFLDTEEKSQLANCIEILWNYMRTSSN